MIGSSTNASHILHSHLVATGAAAIAVTPYSRRDFCGVCGARLFPEQSLYTLLAISSVHFKQFDCVSCKVPPNLFFIVSTFRQIIYWQTILGFNNLGQVSYEALHGGRKKMGGKKAG